MPYDGSGPALLARARLAASSGAGWVWHIFCRFIADRCLVGASALSYTTIVSLVPLTAIVLVTFSGFSVFSDARQRFLEVIIGNFAPEIGEQAAEWFTTFATNAAKTTALGIAALVVTSILLLATIEEHLHFIFRVSMHRHWGQRVIAYWTVLTLGPVLLGVGLSLSGDIDRAMRMLGMRGGIVDRATQAASSGLPLLIPLILETLAFTMLFTLIPNCRVPWRGGLIGAFVAAVLLEISKIGFGIFVFRISSYSNVYGALAGVPIFLLWMYIFWIVVLLGAEVAAVLAGRPESSEILEDPAETT